jgi:hypothetical protein
VTPPPPPPPHIALKKTAAKKAATPAVAAGANFRNRDFSVERYVIGSFQVRIPVKAKADMLHGEENTLAIFKARLNAMSPTNRWRPVIERYLGFLTARVDGLGGNANDIPPSFKGFFPGKPGGREHHERFVERTGKISGLIFDHFGDFEGFILKSEEGENRYFSRETEIKILAERVWRQRLRITVLAECNDPCNSRKIIVREPPAPFED